MLRDQGFKALVVDELAAKDFQKHLKGTYYDSHTLIHCYGFEVTSYSWVGLYKGVDGAPPTALGAQHQPRLDAGGSKACRDHGAECAGADDVHGRHRYAFQRASLGGAFVRGFTAVIAQIFGSTAGLEK